MEYINCGNISLPLLGLGTYSIKGEELRDVVSRALDLGYSLFDTAIKYGNEKDLGVAVSGHKVVVQSKVASSYLLGNLRYLRLNGKSFISAYRSSKLSVGHEQLRVFLLHNPFVGCEKYYLKLAKECEDIAYGICNYSIAELSSLIEKTGIKPKIVQAEIHPYHSNKLLIAYCKDNGIVIEARSPFAHGDVMNEWESDYFLQNMAQKYKKTIPQIILRWITQQDIIAIVRSRDLKHLEENINIFDFTLSVEEMDYIDSMNRDVSFGAVSRKA